MYANEYNICFRIFFLLVFNIALAQVEQDSIKISKNDTITRVEYVKTTRDTLINDSIPKKERLQDVVDYDSYDQYHDVKNQFTYLEKDAIVTYVDNKIEADYIEINWQTGDIYAVGKQDSTGKIVEPAKFTQAGKEIEINSFVLNVKTEKVKAFNVRTEETMSGEQSVIVASVVKNYNDSVQGMRKIAYTTDELFIQKKDSAADYYLQTNEAKYIRGKKPKIITGPIVMKIHDVTTPFALPFAFLPMGGGRSAGFLLPSFGEREDVGFFIQGAGVYIPIGEYADLSLTGDVFTRGSLGLHANSSYKKRYAFNGNFRFDWEKRVTGIKGLDDYTQQTLYRLNWSHRQDAKANPNMIFAANVNFSSSQFFRNGINNQNLINGDVLTNTTSSSISLNKIFPNSPFSAALTLTHNQNNSNSSGTNPVNFNLPTLTVNMNRIYPFAPKSGSKKGLAQNLAVTYNFNLQNTINTTDEDVFTGRMFDDMQNGARHQVNLNTGVTLLNYFPLNFTAGYEEVWTLETINRRFDPLTQEVITEEESGFGSFRTFNVASNIQTVLYNTKIFGNEDDDKLIKGIRHMVTPTLGFSFRPDFSTEGWGYYDTYLDADGQEVSYSRFEGGIYGSPGRGTQANVNFGLTNNLEMKVRSRKDSTGLKKIKIFDYLNINSSYNIAADSLNFSPIEINGATSILDGKMRVNFGARMNLYQTRTNPETGVASVVNELGAPRLTNYNVALSYSLNNSTFGDAPDMNYSQRGAVRQEDYYFDDDHYAKFTIPWDLSIQMNQNFTRQANGETNNNTTLRLSGGITPTPHWKITGSSGYDFQTGEVTFTRLSFQRDLRSFVINFSWVPFGQYRTWDFFVGIKASFLRDAVKYEENNFNVPGQQF